MTETCTETGKDDSGAELMSAGDSHGVVSGVSGDADKVVSPGIVLRYREGRVFVAQVLFIALAPLWGLYAVSAIISLLIEAAGKLAGSQIGVEQLLLPLLFYIALAFGGFLALKTCSDSNLALDSNGIRFPRYLLFETRFRLFRPWQTLKNVQFRSLGRSTGPQSVNLNFEDGASVKLALNALAPEDLKELILAVQVFSPQAQFTPSLRELDLNLSQGESSLLNLPTSYTELWEQDLAGRFGSTIFVPLEPGQELTWSGKKLKVLAQLAFGGLSAVYLVKSAVDDGAFGVEFNEVMVLKEAVLPANLDSTLENKALEMFEREARLLSSLNHPRLARVVDYFIVSGRHYILLAHIEGADLRRFVVEHGAQPPLVVVRWFRELIAILRYLQEHDPPVVHRDLTPDNIILARDGRLSVIDFGAANNLVGTATGTIVGKQSYIAPEQFRGKACGGSDVYALAATMGFALTGKDPEPLTQSKPGRETKNAPDLGRLIASCTEQELSSRLVDLSVIEGELLKLATLLAEEGR